MKYLFQRIYTNNPHCFEKDVMQNLYFYFCSEYVPLHKMEKLLLKQIQTHVIKWKIITQNTDTATRGREPFVAIHWF